MNRLNLIQERLPNSTSDTLNVRYILRGFQLPRFIFNHVDVFSLDQLVHEEDQTNAVRYPAVRKDTTRQRIDSLGYHRLTSHIPGGSISICNDTAEIAWGSEVAHKVIVPAPFSYSTCSDIAIILTVEIVT